MLRTALIGTSLGAAVAVPAAAEAKGPKKKKYSQTLKFDVACRGSTARNNIPLDANLATGDLYGATIMVEGYMYEAGTLDPGITQFDPEDDASHPHIGHWFCNSTFVLGPRRGVPHLLGHQQYVFGLMTTQTPFIKDQIVSHGFEGQDTAPGTFNRAVTGGVGKYEGASGTAYQKIIGTNASQIFGHAAPSFQFTIKLL